MVSIKSKNTQLEIIVRKFLHSQGFLFRLHNSSLPGKPDAVLKKYRLCIFMHGCFWHYHDGCRFATIQKNNVDSVAINLKNRWRDIHDKIVLLETGWRVLELWQCSLNIMIKLLSGYLVIWLSGYLVIWLSGYLVIWLSGYLVIWLSGYLVIWLY